MAAGFASLAGAAFAQDDVSTQLWADYHAHYYRGESMELYADSGLRFASSPDEFVRFYLRPSFRYHYSQLFRLHAGLGVFATDNIDAANTLEIRPWQGVKVRWPTLGPLVFNNLVRFEQRITFASGADDPGFQLRLRYQLGTNIPLMPVPWKGFFVPASIEWFWDAGDEMDQFADDLRLSAGVGYVVNEVWLVNCLLTIERSSSTVDSGFTTADIIFRFQLKQLLSKRDYRGRIEAPDS